MQDTYISTSVRTYATYIFKYRWTNNESIKNGIYFFYFLNRIPNVADRWGIRNKNILRENNSPHWGLYASVSLDWGLYRKHRLSKLCTYLCMYVVTMHVCRQPCSITFTKKKSRDRCYDFLNIFLQKNFAKKLTFFVQNKAYLCKNWIITLVFEKNANFFAENWQKSQKIVIKTSTPSL
jgi:hypothetical protein